MSSNDVYCYIDSDIDSIIGSALYNDQTTYEINNALYDGNRREIRLMNGVERWYLSRSNKKYIKVD